jgi:hypothetical protein
MVAFTVYCHWYWAFLHFYKSNVCHQGTSNFQHRPGYVITLSSSNSFSIFDSDHFRMFNLFSLKCFHHWISSYTSGHGYMVYVMGMPTLTMIVGTYLSTSMFDLIGWHTKTSDITSFHRRILQVHYMIFSLLGSFNCILCLQCSDLFSSCCFLRWVLMFCWACYLQHCEHSAETATWSIVCTGPLSPCQGDNHWMSITTGGGYCPMQR